MTISTTDVSVDLDMWVPAWNSEKTDCSGWCGCCSSNWGHSCDKHRYCLVMERVDLFVLWILCVYTLSLFSCEGRSVKAV